MTVKTIRMRTYKNGEQALVYGCPVCTGEVRITVNKLGGFDYVATCNHFVEYSPQIEECSFTEQVD